MSLLHEELNPAYMKQAAIPGALAYLSLIIEILKYSNWAIIKHFFKSLLILIGRYCSICEFLEGYS